MSARDPHGDVAATESAADVDPAVVASIDLQHVTVTRQAHGLRVVVRLKEVLPSRGRFVQQIGIAAMAPGWAGASWVFFVSVTPQHLGGALAFFVEVEDDGEPEPCRVDAAKGSQVVRLTIPDRCLPEDRGHLSVSSILLDKRSSDPLLAEDDLEIRGNLDLTPRG